MAALLAWLGCTPQTRLTEGRFAAALARLALYGRAGCDRISLPGFELARLRAGTPAEVLTGPPRVQPQAPRLAGALTGWLCETGATARTLGLAQPADQTELLLGAFERRAQSGLLALKGQFAALVFDPRAHELWLHLDAAGNRGLFVRAEADGCWVASDESALVEGDAVAALEPLELARYLCALAPSADAGWFRGVRSVGPGGLWRIAAGDARCLLEAALPAIAVPRADAEVVAQFGALQQQAAVRCAAGVEAAALGLSMSGGLDSLGVAAWLRRAGVPVRALSWTLPGTPDSDEGAAVRAAAAALELSLQQFDGDGLLPLGGAPRLKPRGELLSNLYRELKQHLYGIAASAGVRVLLNGNGGDQLYGPPRQWLVETLSQGHPLAALAELWWRIRHQVPPWRDPAVRAWGRRWLGRPAAQPALLASVSPAWRNRVQDSLATDRDPREQLLRGAYAARAAAAEHLHAEWQGLELRSPWRDADLLGYVARLPAHQLARRGDRKWLGRTALRGVLPEAQRLAPKRGNLRHFLERALMAEPGQQWSALLNRAAETGVPVAIAPLRSSLADPATASEINLLQLWLVVSLQAWREACATPAR